MKQNIHHSISQNNPCSQISSVKTQSNANYRVIYLSKEEIDRLEYRKNTLYYKRPTVRNKKRKMPTAANIVLKIIYGQLLKNPSCDCIKSQKYIGQSMYGFMYDKDLKPRQIRNITKKLKEEGVITFEQTKVGRERRSNRYKVDELGVADYWYSVKNNVGETRFECLDNSICENVKNIDDRQKLPPEKDKNCLPNIKIPYINTHIHIHTSERFGSDSKLTEKKEEKLPHIGFLNVDPDPDPEVEKPKSSKINWDAPPIDLDSPPRLEPEKESLQSTIKYGHFGSAYDPENVEHDEEERPPVRKISVIPRVKEGFDTFIEFDGYENPTVSCIGNILQSRLEKIESENQIEIVEELHDPFVMQILRKTFHESEAKVVSKILESVKGPPSLKANIIEEITLAVKSELSKGKKIVCFGALANFVKNRVLNQNVYH